jgi:hypothetical protein
MKKRGYHNEDGYSKSATSVLRWMGVQFLLVIPIINIILVIAWAISSKHPSKRNYCIAAIIWFIIFVTLTSVAVYQLDYPVTGFIKNINSNWRRVPAIIELIKEKGDEIFSAEEPAPQNITLEPYVTPTPDATATTEVSPTPEETIIPADTSMPDPT